MFESETFNFDTRRSEVKRGKKCMREQVKNAVRHVASFVLIDHVSLEYCKTCNCILPGKRQINIKFLGKFEKSATKIAEAFGEETLHLAHVFNWHKRFSGGRDSGEDDERDEHLKAVGSLVVRAPDRTGVRYFPKYPSVSNAGSEIVEMEMEYFAIYRPLWRISPSLQLNRTVTCMVLKTNDRRTSSPCHDEFRGPRSDYVRQSVFRIWMPLKTHQVEGKISVQSDVAQSPHVDVLRKFGEEGTSSESSSSLDQDSEFRGTSSIYNVVLRHYYNSPKRIGF
ncbi:hypothetical protein TNCV_3147971 [Trichonephila clavipes]|nr:hypothetical protein TNCV_3147971 [Trichonephila clavipes]